MFKKTVSLLMAVCLLLCLAACGDKASDKSRSDDSEPKTKYSASVLKGAILSTKELYNLENNFIASRVAAFSSTDFIYNDFSDYNIDNKLLTKLVTERVSGATSEKTSFAPKHIKKETKSEE